MNKNKPTHHVDKRSRFSIDLRSESDKSVYLFEKNFSPPSRLFCQHDANKSYGIFFLLIHFVVKLN